MIVPSLIVLPFVLAVWMLDTLVFLISLRLVLGQVRKMRASTFYVSLRQLVDWIPQRVKTLLARRLQQRQPAWLPWLIVIFGAIVLRQLLVGVVISLS